MRVAIAGHHISVETSDEWDVAEGWTDPAAQQLHGVYLRSASSDAQINVRALPGTMGRHGLTLEGLIALLREQNWARGPFDEVRTVVGNLIVVAGTFEMNRKDLVVREYFVSDGVRLANAAMPGPRESVAAAQSSADRLVLTLRFELLPGVS
jgi:hypothetical protein